MRSAILFMLAILTPCSVLGWLSWRSMRDEANVIRRQKTGLYQQSADIAARAAADFMNGQLRAFGESVDRLLGADSPAGLQRRFHQALRSSWPLADTGLAMETETAGLLPQVEPSEPQVTAFVSRASWFFDPEPRAMFVSIPDGEPPSVTPVSQPATVSVPAMPTPASITDILNELAPVPPPPAPVSAPAPPAAGKPLPAPAAKRGPDPAAPELRVDLATEVPAAPDTSDPADSAPRLVRPEVPATPDPGLPSSVRPVTTTLARLLSKYETGMVSVPHENGLFTFLWYRPRDAPRVTFAVALDPAALTKALATHQAFAAPDDDTCLALIDQAQKPAAQWTGDGPFKPESWTAPLVSREIGTTLPRWEAAIFLRDPAVFTHAASAWRWQLGLIVTIASLVAITGATFILRDARRAARDARLKTDFVSNVSHELKTPLTSIRMFSDLLGSNPEVPPETKRYAEVIAGEAARLTRLINNVLNFSRMEGGKENLQSALLELRSLTTATIDQMRPQLEKDGFSLEVDLPDSPVTISGDSDALSQVLLNLLSNAGKYGIAPDRPPGITVRLTETSGRVLLAVADRGPGVPRGHERRIFEKFKRAHDTLASGTAGSGLGLTIARRLVEVHGGTLEYSPRDGGGAVFTVSLPVTAA